MSSGYELHQKLRTKTVRLVKKKQYDEAISTLHSGALTLLSQSEQGSGCDLAVYMIDVYTTKDQPVDSESRDRITEILAQAAPDFWRKKVVDAAVKWSVKASGASTGDPLLRLFIAKMYAKEGDFEHAEGHFLASCIETEQTYAVESAPKSYAQAMAEWLTAFAQQASQQQGETRSADAIARIEAGRFALRATIPLLANHAVKPALSFQEKYLSLVTSSLKSLLLPVTPNPRPYTPPGSPTPSTDIQLYLTANPDLNFSQLAVALVSESHKLQRRVPEWLRNAWIQLVRQYEREAPSLLEEDGVREAIPRIGEDWFGLKVQRGGGGGNMLNEMMASLFGGAPAGGAGQGRAEEKRQIQGAGAAPKPKSAVQGGAPAPTATQAAANPTATADDLVDDEMD
ncbi:Golgi to ER traffic protein 4 [Pseudozyma hubeiensis]|nr:Golgi to ER traffic protein 4 [Pseudozyma hubeiensis]